MNLVSKSAVKQKAETLYRLNRLDLLELLKTAYEQRNTTDGPFGELDPEPNEIPIVGYKSVHSFEPLKAHHPPPGELSVHKRSAADFAQGEVGHAFTGLVSIRHNKIYLFPTAPTAKWPVRPYGDFKARVHKAQDERPPIIHGEGGPGHSQLASHVVVATDKWKDMSQERGDFVGFTIVKGDRARQIPHRYTFKSDSSNKPAFRPEPPAPPPVPRAGAGLKFAKPPKPRTNLGHTGQPTAGWAQTIWEKTKDLP